MIIKNLHIRQFRNIHHSILEFSPLFNVFYGHNGSGKTSLLEAIYYLGLGKSFRTSNSCRVIQNESEACSIVSQLQAENTRLIPLGIERNRQGQRILRKDGENVPSILALAQELPLQFISADSHILFTEGPKLRRQFFDWGLFHVEPRFYPLWQQLQKVLKQRNSALKAKLSAHEIKSWDAEFIRISVLIDELRQEHLKYLQSASILLFKHLLPELALEIEYYRGWPAEQELSSSLDRNFYRDLQLGYTQLGPQRADLLFSIHSTPIQDYLSQGQLKLAAYALHLAQGKMLQEWAYKSPIYLIDDIPSELDAEKRHLVIQMLSQLKAQAFITGIDQADLSEIMEFPASKLFHVEQGSIRHHEDSAIYASPLVEA